MEQVSKEARKETKDSTTSEPRYSTMKAWHPIMFLRHRRIVHHTTSAQSSKRLLTIAQPAATQRTTTTTVCIPVVSDRLCIFCARCKHNTTRAPGVWKHSQDPDRVISKEPTSSNPAQYKNTKEMNTTKFFKKWCVKKSVIPKNALLATTTTKSN